jgi:predicted glycogen debranching enzyme
MIDIDRDTLRDFERASRLEWLETDGLGGWAGSTLTAAHSRRDHHLLRLPAAAPAAAIAASAAADPAAAGGTVALSKLDEMVIDASGGVHELACNRFPFFVAAPGVRHLAAFRRDLFPVFEHEAGGIRLQKTVALLERDGALVVLYEVLAAPGPFVLALRPFFARREPGALCRADRHGSAPEAVHEPAGLRLRWPSGAEIFLAVAADLDHRPDWWYRFELEHERGHGREFQEDLWTPGLLRRELRAGDTFGLVAAAGGATDRDPLELLAQERRRRETLLDRLPVKDELTRVLALAADQFTVRRPGGARLLAAGHPGGEAAAGGVIAMPGVLLATGRADDAKKQLRAWARATGAAAGAGAGAGALAHRHAGTAGEARQDPPDDALWLFVAAWRYLQATGDEALVRDTLLPALGKIAAALAVAEPAGATAPEGRLRVAADGLLEAAPGSPAAARRPGKAVEINALWHNALATLADLSGRLGDGAQAKLWGERARRVQRRFAEIFWNAAAGCLYDSVQPAGVDPALRAHQVLAIGLPFAALSKQRGQRLLHTLEERLWTPVGLRDLAPASEAAEAAGAGDGDGDGGPSHGLAGRTDLAWPWLLGPLLAAQVRLRAAAGRRQALQLLAELDPLLSACVIGSIPELLTVEPPHTPVGHAAHAAAIGELLRVYVDDLHAAKAPPPAPSRRPGKPKPQAKPAAGGKARPRRGRGRQGGS